MAEFDLGTAHGRIVIRSDNRGAAQTTAAMATLERSIAQLNRSMAGVERALDNFTSATQRMETRLRSTNVEVDRTQSRLGRLASVASGASTGVRNFTGELASLAQQAVRTGEQIDGVTTAIQRLGSVHGVLGGLIGAFSGTNDQMANLPIWQRNILSVGRAISGYTAASRILGTFAGRLGAVVASTAAFGLLATRVNSVRRHAGLLAGTLGLIFPSLNSLENGFRNLGRQMGLAGSQTGDLVGSLARTARGMSQTLSGVLLLSSALGGLARAAKLAVAGLSVLALAGGAIKALGVIVLGVVNAVTQLSGALLIVPGILGQIGIAAGVAKLGFDRLKVAMEAAFGDSSKFEEAIKDLSPHMQSVARETQKFASRIKGLRDIAADQIFAGLNDDIKNLGNTLLPFVEKGVAQVGRSLNSVKNAFRDFLVQPQTIRDLETAFALTGVSINNASRGLQPMLNALRDIGIVGMKVFTELTGGIGIAARSFEGFIANARHTGELEGWIRSGIQGFKDLGAAVTNFGKGIATVFRAFGADGENALARMRTAAEKFNQKMEQSARSGSLRTVAEALDRMASAGLQALIALMQELAQVMQSIAPFAERLSTAFSQGLVTAIQAVGAAANILASALSKLSGVGEIVGTMLALGIAFKGLQLLMIPIIRSAQLMAGAFLALRGVTNVITGVNGSMRALGASTTVASAAMAGLSRAGTAVLSFMGGPIGVAITAVVGALYSLKAASDATGKAQGQYATNAQHAAEGTDSLVEAFERAGGVIDKGVFDQLISNIRTLRQDLEETAQTSTGFFADLGAEFKDFFSGQSESLIGEEVADSNAAMNRSFDETARKAREASDALKDLGVSDTQIAAAVAGTQGEWDAFVARLHSLGDSGKEAVTALSPMRQTFVGIQDSMTRIGPDSVRLAEAFQTLASASSTASEKLDAIRSALTALGILESSATEAAFRLTETIQQVGEAASGSLGPANQLGQALLNAQGGFETTNGSAKLLHDELKKLGDALIETAATGGDVNAAYAQMQGALDALATQSDLSRKEIDALARSVGVAPEELNILVSLKGATEAQAELRAVLVEASRFQGQTFEIVAQAKTEQARAALSQLGFQVQLINSETGEVKVTGNTADAQAKLQAILQAAALVGQQNPQIPVGTNAPAVTQQFTQLQGAILGIPPGTQVPVQAPGLQQTNQSMGLLTQLMLGLPPSVSIPVQAPNVGPVGQAVEGVQQTVEQLPPGVSIPVQAPGVQSTSDAFGILFGQLSQPQPPVEIKVSAPGTPEATQAIEGLTTSVNNSKTAFEGFVVAVQGAMTNISGAITAMVSGATTQLEGLGSKGQASGAALGQGFADGIRGKVDAVRQAALELAEAASQPLPRSPAEIGPFSGRGWTLYRGQALALGFSEGIVDSIPKVRQDTLDLARAVADAMDSIRAAFQMPQTSFGANRPAGPSGSRFFRDPAISNEELQHRRIEKDRQKAEQAALDERFRESDEAKRAAKEESSASKESTKATGRTTKSMQELAEQFNLTITSNKRNEPGSFHNTGEAFDFAGSAEDMRRFNEFVARTDPGARELFFDPGINIDEGQRIGAIGGHTDHVHYVPSRSTEKAAETISKNTREIGSTQSDIVDAIVSEGKRRGLTNEEIAAGVSAGIVESNLQNLGDLPGEFDSQGVFQQRPSQGWGAPGNVQQDIEDFFDAFEKTDRDLTPAQRAQAVQRSAFPDRYAQRMAEAEELVAESLQRQGEDVGSFSSIGESSLGTQEEMLDELRKSNQALYEQVQIAKNPDASDADVIRALQAIDDEISLTRDREIHDGLEGIRDAVMEDRGIKKYDPFEGASQDPVKDLITLAQNVVGIFNIIKGGLDALTEVTSILARGIENTEDIHRLVDGFQSLLSTVGEFASTVGSIVEVIGSLAALAGAAIPGIGQVATVVSAITGGIGNINAIVDLVQEVFRIGGWILGNILSSLAGGAEGPLTGNVHILLDRNDNTIKTWSDANPEDKRVHPLGPSTSTTNNNAPQNLNVYAGPGVDPYQMMNEAMYAIRASNAGVYG